MIRQKLRAEQNSISFVRLLQLMRYSTDYISSLNIVEIHRCDATSIYDMQLCLLLFYLNTRCNVMNLHLFFSEALSDVCLC
jgi:hypothetical protein